MDIPDLQRTFERELASIASEADLRELRDRYLARKGGVAANLLKDVASAGADERRTLGQAANQFKQHGEAAIASAQASLAAVSADRERRANAVDVTLPGRPPLAGHRHPLTLLRERVEAIFLRFGFLIVEGPELEDDYHNFEALNMPAEHPARDMKDTLVAFARELFGAARGTRFRPSFFPYTEPSGELDITCAACGGRGCGMCKGTGWIEILGSGLVHPAVLENVGYDSERYTGFAFGVGIERLALLKWGVEDIRLFYENDLRFLEQFPL